jgi:predicted NBD/HSP70 family sugar kinase
VTLWATGVGAAIFADGSLYHGIASSAGEWGHTNVVVGGSACRCGALGCLEAYIGATALLRDWEQSDPSVSLPAELEQDEWIGRLLAAADSSRAAAEVLERAATYFGTAAANLVNLFNPELIVVGGWVGRTLGPRLLPAIRSVIAAQALDYSADRVSVELGRLGNDAVALGASTLVIEALLAGGGRPPA